MRAISLLYHDIISDGDDRASGFPGVDANRYKLSAQEFGRHLQLISSATGTRPATVEDILANKVPNRPWLLTLDDGGISATSAARLLSEANWKAHFFITTNFIDTETFVSKEQIRELRQAGNVIGTHSCSHPNPMAGCSYAVLLDEWKRSIDTLGEIMNEPVVCGSVPGGAYSRTVAAAAAEAGLRALFTSEPTERCWQVDDCQIFGRYSYRRGIRAATMAALASGKLLPRLQSSVAWNCKKLVKRAAGPAFYRVRTLLLDRSVRPHKP